MSYLKLAATKYKEVLRSGEMTPTDLGRLLRESESDTVSGIRSGLQRAATDLTPEELVRHRRLNALLATQKMKNVGGKLSNVPVVGPATVLGKPHVSPTAGTSIRLTEKTKGLALPLAAIPNVPSVLERALMKPEDKSVFKGLVEHELSERDLFNSASNGYKPQFFASHAGTAPILAENLATWRDPQANSIFSKVRQLNPEDAHVFAKMKQFGATPSNPLPIGSKGHAALEWASKDALTNTGGMAKRLITEGPIGRKGQADLARTVSIADRATDFLEKTPLKGAIESLKPKIEQWKATIAKTHPSAHTPLTAHALKRFAW